MRYQYSKGPIESKVAVIIALALFWLLMLALMQYPDVIERYYSQGLYIAVCWILHPVWSLIPFSVGDVFYIILIFYGLYALIKILKWLILKRFKATFIYFLKLVIGFQILVLAFYLLWGLNYFRPSAAKRLDLQDTSYTYNDIKTVTSMLIDSANACRSRLSFTDTLQNDRSVYHAAEKAIDTLSKTTKGFPAIHPHIKASLLSYFMNYLGTSGYYNPFTSEAQLNCQMPIHIKPFTACHEMTHQMGFGAEDEANFGGFVSGVASHNRLLRYSAYYSGMQEFMYTVYRNDSLDYKQLRTKISPLVMRDRKTERVYWKSFESKAGILSSIFYDNYLKTNNQPQGLKTYNRMIRLVMAWYRKQPQYKQVFNK